MIATRFLVLLLTPAVLAEVPESPRKLIGADWQEKALQYWNKVQEKAELAWEGVKHVYDASGLDKVTQAIKDKFPDTTAALNELSSRVQTTFVNALEGAGQIYDIVTDSFKDVSEDMYKDCQKVDGEVDLVKCAKRVMNNVQDLINCKNITFELAFGIQCTDDMDARLNHIVDGFKAHFNSEANGKIADASVRLLQDCTTATSTRELQDASKEAEPESGNTTVPDSTEADSKSGDTKVPILQPQPIVKPEYVKVEVELDVDVSSSLTEDNMDEFTKQTDAIKTKLTELENKDELPEWFKTAFPYAKAPVLVSHELSVCEIVDTAQLILNNDDEKTPGLLQQYNGIMKQLQELKNEAEAENVKSTVKGWFSNMWQKARNWFGNVKSEVEKKVAALEELKDKIGKTIDAAHQAIRDRLDSSESEKPAPGAKALRRLKEVRRLSVGPKGEHIILI
jgi:hypothetical protein